MPLPVMTEEEIISYLGRTDLPTVLVEGKTDAMVYRWLENRWGILGGSILICSGRSVLLSIYRKRHQFTHSRVAWLADSDMWLFTGPPADLSDVVFTAGYSIENDVYAGSALEDLLDPAEQALHRILLSLTCRWFAFEIQECRAARQFLIDVHLNQFIDIAQADLSLTYCNGRGFTEPDAQAVADVLINYKLQLRGKTLMQVLVHLLSAPARTSKYSYTTAMEVAFKLNPNNPHIQRLVAEVSQKLA